MMQGEALARFIVGLIGNAIAGFRYISPAPTFLRILKKKSTEDFHPYPYLATVINCSVWLFYGLPMVNSSNTLLVTNCAIGLFFQTLYLAIFFIYSHKYRGTIIIFLLAEAFLIGVMMVITLLCFHTIEKRSVFVGIIADVVGIIMYASPLSILDQVWKTKSVEFLPFWLCLACFFNGISWTTYAVLKTFDLFLAVGHSIGAALSFIELCVYFYYKPKDRRQVQS